ncbi:hypothetical protein B0H15DRAFT_777783, partial [Mycena belliarum]
KRTLSATVNKVMFGLTLFMYVLSVAYWCYSVADGANRLYSYIGLAINPAKVLPDHTQVTRWSPLFDALTLLNYVVSDGIVVWRAWVICLRKHRMFLWITVVLLGLTALTVLLTIIFRIVDLVESSISELDVHRLIDIFQVATLGTSLLSNLSATGVVSVTAWLRMLRLAYALDWRTIRSSFSDKKNTSSRSNNILLLVVESGVVYCLSAAHISFFNFVLADLGDLYTTVQVQIAGAYPSVVLLLVSTQRSLNESSFTDDSTFEASRAEEIWRTRTQPESESDQRSLCA